MSSKIISLAPESQLPIRQETVSAQLEYETMLYIDNKSKGEKGNIIHETIECVRRWQQYACRFIRYQDIKSSSGYGTKNMKPRLV